MYFIGSMLSDHVLMLQMEMGLVTKWLLVSIYDLGFGILVITSWFVISRLVYDIANCCSKPDIEPTFKPRILAVLKVMVLMEFGGMLTSIIVLVLLFCFLRIRVHLPKGFWIK